MSVGILLITQGDIGKSLLDIASTILGELPLKVRCVSVSTQTQPDKLLDTLRQEMPQLDSGDGVLILSDLYGATPCNLANTLASEYHAQTVAGVNMPMLLRIMNYHQLPLAELAENAISGGSKGIVHCAHAT